MAIQLDFTPQNALSEGVYAGGAKAYFYEAGTLTPITTYTSTSLATPHPTPLVADSYGVFEQVFTDGFVGVKCVITTAVDAAIVTLDPVISSVTDGSDAASISFSPVTGNPETDVQAAIENNTSLLIDPDKASSKDFTDDDDLSVDPDNVGTRGNVAANLATSAVQGDWDDGTSTTEHTLSPAKLAEAMHVYGAPTVMEYDFSVDGAVSSYDFTGLADFSMIEIETSITITSSGTMNIRVSTDDGTSFYSAGYKSAARIGSSTSSSTTAIICTEDNVGDFVATAKALNFNNANHYTSFVGVNSPGGVQISTFGGMRESNEANNAMRFVFSSATTAGKITLRCYR